MKLKIPNLFGCDDLSLKLWDRCKQVEVGTRVETAVVGTRTEQVPAGTRTESYVAGWQKQTVTVGEKVENVAVGTRDESREVGQRTETVVVAPATTRVVRERVDLPAEPVTVVVSGDAKAAAPQPGTTRVLTEDEFRRAIAESR